MDASAKHIQIVDQSIFIHALAKDQDTICSCSDPIEDQDEIEGSEKAQDTSPVLPVLCRTELQQLDNHQLALTILTCI